MANPTTNEFPMLPPQVHKKWKQALQMPIGPLLSALIAADSGGGFDSLELYLDPGFEPIPGMTPANARTFASTGFDLGHFCFMSDGSGSSDERPICHAEKGDCHVVAPRLVDFLSVVAVAGAHMIGRDFSDKEYWDLRKERLVAAPGERRIGAINHRPFVDGGVDFRRASDLLLTLPGVSLPEKPSLITNACPDPDFDLHLEVEEVLILTLPRIEELVAKRKLPEAKKTLEALVKRWMELGDLIPAQKWLELKTHITELQPKLTADQRAKLQAYGA